MSPLLLLLLAVLLFPIAVYLMILGMINRRARPLMVPGTWDFVGILLATSGFLLFVGPAMVSGVFRQSLRELPLHRESPSLGNAVAEIWGAWWVLWLCYYLLVLGGAAFLVWTRRNTTIIYNVHLQTVEHILTDAAKRMGLEMDRRGNRLYFAEARESPVVEETHVTADPHMATALDFSRYLSRPAAIVDVDAVPLLNNAALHWLGGAREVTTDLKRELGNSLTGVVAPVHPVSSWLFGISAVLFLLIMALTGFFVMLMLFATRR